MTAASESAMRSRTVECVCSDSTSWKTSASRRYESTSPSLRAGDEGDDVAWGAPGTRLFTSLSSTRPQVPPLRGSPDGSHHELNCGPEAAPSLERGIPPYPVRYARMPVLGERRRTRDAPSLVPCRPGCSGCAGERREDQEDRQGPRRQGALHRAGREGQVLRPREHDQGEGPEEAPGSAQGGRRRGGNRPEEPCGGGEEKEAVDRDAPCRITGGSSILTTLARGSGRRPCKRRRASMAAR